MFFLDKFSINFFISVEGVKSFYIASNCHSGYHLRLIYQYCLRGCFEHNVKEGGGGVTKQVSRLIYIIPSTYTGEIFGLLTFE